MDTKCSLEGCTNNKYMDNSLCYECFSHKRPRLAYWRQEKRKKRSAEQLLKRKEEAFKRREAKRLAAEYKNIEQLNYIRTGWGRFTGAKSVAARRGLSWSLTLYDYKNLIRGNKCFYCKGGLPPTGVGLDRKNNLLGYELDNVVPCCRSCNTIKGEHLTFNEMVQVSDLLLRLRSKTEVGI